MPDGGNGALITPMSTSVISTRNAASYVASIKCCGPKYGSLELGNATP